MFEYLRPADRDVIDGLKKHEVIYAADQPEYIPLRTLKSKTFTETPEGYRTYDGRVLSRWTLTEEQRKAVAAGADIFLELMTFNQPLQPIRMAVIDTPSAEYFFHEYGLATRENPTTEKPLTVKFVFTGNERVMKFSPSFTLAACVDWMAKDANRPEQWDEFEVRDEKGNLLDPTAALRDLSVAGRTFNVNLPAGFGG